ncbi:DUF7878 domain-containing protein [Streptomyces sp. SAT1]|uniref:DUF7878 domain-containing protein n=1 Tax=Streptomyces sp. SAT1 TaxID=1849967 RepID=UPI000AF5E5CF|nr:hypothetical protein [Streptomyces sp. SAT1]
MRFVCRNFGLSDLPRRGLAPQEAPLEVVLLDIEAELSVRENERVLWREEQFPVAELAYHLALWLQSPAAGHDDFELDSMQAEKGLIRIVDTRGGWRIGSAFAPDFRTSPVTWDSLVAELRQFDRVVREGVTALGIEPAFIPIP